MRILYVFPHPDDESYGPARVMSKQRRQGHEVYLLTLTRGGATRQRHKYGSSVAEMGEVRFKEMVDVAQVLDLTGMTVLDLPDSGLQDGPARDRNRNCGAHRVGPARCGGDGAVHGISGFFDHIITHAVVKRAYVELRERVDYLKRLAFWTIRAEEAAGASELFHLTGSRAEDIDVLVTVDEVDVEKQQQALDCYVTYRETIEAAGARRNIPREAVFELYQEVYEPPLGDLFGGLTEHEQ